LGALSEESRLSVIIQLEKGGTSFDLCLHETWRCNFQYAVSLERISECGEQGRAKTKDTGGCFTAED
jgi:hypothetical protein